MKKYNKQEVIEHLEHLVKGGLRGMEVMRNTVDTVWRNNEYLELQAKTAAFEYVYNLLTGKFVDRDVEVEQ